MWYKIKSTLIKNIANIRLYWLGLIIFGDSHYKVKGPHMRQILDLLEPGDVLLRRYNHYLGSVLIKGFFSHAAFLATENEVIHMLADGITKEDILTFMRCDHIAILRPKNIAVVPRAIELANQQMGKGITNPGSRNIQYDYDFDTNKSDKQYCTEFINYIFDNPIDKKTILPDDIKDCDLFSLIYSTRSE